MTKTVYHIEVAKLGHSLSGGETSMLELIKYFSKKDYRNVIITTDNGKSTYEKILGSNKNVTYRVINSYQNEAKYGALISYLLRLKLVRPILHSLKPNKDDIVICHSEFFPNSVTNWLFLRRFPSITSACYYHMRAPRLFKGYEGEFDNSFNFPNLRLMNYHINQWLCKKLTSKNTTIFTVNTYYEKFLNKEYPNNKVVILENFGGAPLLHNTDAAKIYDILWIGRFHAQKGLNDLIEIIAHVKKARGSVKAVILGGGNEEIRQNLINNITSYGLEDSVELAGEIPGDKKYDYFSKSKIFAMTSHYESFGIVNLEAMGSGLPVVSYNLPVYSAFKSGLIKVPNGDKVTFSNKITELLEDNTFYQESSRLSRSEASRHTWDKTGQQVEVNIC